jgi:hypothetical protein
MSTRSRFLARLVGLFLTAMAICMAPNKASMVATIVATVHDPALLLVYGMIALAIGLAMVIVHNRWSGGAATVIVTIIGWLMLVRSIALLMLPQAAVLALFQAVHFADLFYAYVIFILAIGLYLNYASWRPGPVEP